jgi:propanol-preferring alcohol dehydrogenase
VAYDSLTTSGRAVVIGAGKGDIQIPTRALMLSERIVTGSRHSTRTELIETMEIMARGVIQPVIGMRQHFTEVETIFDAILEEKLLGRGALTYE